MRMFEKLPHFDFMKWKGVALTISWGIILICLLLARPWSSNSRVKVGMQFTGGIDMMVRFTIPMEADEIRKALQQGGINDAALVSYSSPAGTEDYSIKVKARQGQDSKDSTIQIDKIKDVLKKLDPQSKTDPRHDLNTESSLALSGKWYDANLLGLAGDEQSKRATYDGWAGQVTEARDNKGSISNYNELPSGLPAPLREMLQKEFRLGHMTVRKIESFSPSISGEWTAKTLKAVFWASVAILFYVMFRFTVSFAVGGIVALIHDVLMALGLFVLFGYEFSVPVVASFLILMGYSMADTIVVFDRIRENSHKPEYRRVPITKLINDSINQTLSRTILTSLSVLFVAFCLLVFGGPALRDLSFPIFVGVITGTYSSIYIASPVVVYWDRWFGGKDKLKQHA